MNLGLLFLLLGVGAVFAFGDFFDSSNTDEETEGEDDNIRSGTDDADLIFTDGGEIIDGLDGDDTLVSFGDSTLLGGEGDDTLISIGGGALLNGGTGADLFVIVPLDVSDSGDLLDLDAQPVAPTVINDFDPDEDQLLIDLRDSSLLPEDAAPVLLTGVVAPDGEGLMIQVNGVNVVQLSSYGGFGDAGMQFALEDLVNDFQALDIIGASIIFPPPALPAGLSVNEDENGNVTLVLTDAFTGGGNFSGGEQFSILDMRAISADLLVTVSAENIISVTPADASWNTVTFAEIDRIILGNGNDLFDGSEGRAQIQVVAGNGADTLVGSNSSANLVGAGFENGMDDRLIWDGVGPTDLRGGAGDDQLLGGLGDTLTGGAGEDRFQVWGYGQPGAGPAVITDFNPDDDALEYSWVTSLDTEDFREVTTEDSEDGLRILEDGEVVVILPGVTLADAPRIFAGDRSVSLPV